MDLKGYSPSWSGFDSAAISASIVVATALRFWRLGSPSEPVYDETKVLRQAQSFLRGWHPPYSSHPPAGKLLVALSVFLFGNYPWGWRAANALMGTALAPITYLLARRLFRSKLAASIAAGSILCEGMFLVASRLAMINIVYITFGAWAYLMLWCFVQNPVPRQQRSELAAMSILLGLFVASKAAISEVGVSLTLVVIAATLIVEGQAHVPAESPKLIARRIIGACGFVAGIVLIVYLAVFVTYYMAVWRGIGDFVAYHRRVLNRNLNLPTSFLNASPFWSWPLLLHAYGYWKKDLLNGATEVIMCGEIRSSGGQSFPRFLLHWFADTHREAWLGYFWPADTLRISLCGSRYAVTFSFTATCRHCISACWLWPAHSSSAGTAAHGDGNT